MNVFFKLLFYYIYVNLWFVMLILWKNWFKESYNRYFFFCCFFIGICLVLFLKLLFKKKKINGFIVNVWNDVSKIYLFVNEKYYWDLDIGK